MLSKSTSIYDFFNFFLFVYINVEGNISFSSKFSTKYSIKRTLRYIIILTNVEACSVGTEKAKSLTFLMDRTKYRLQNIYLEIKSGMYF